MFRIPLFNVGINSIQRVRNCISSVSTRKMLSVQVRKSFKVMYESGYRTWFSVPKMIMTESETQTPRWEYLFELQQPSFPGDLGVDTSFSNIILAKRVPT